MQPAEQIVEQREHKNSQISDPEMNNIARNSFNANVLNNSIFDETSSKQKRFK